MAVATLLATLLLGGSALATPLEASRSASARAGMVSLATFWGRPFPDGYVWHSRCYRYVRVRTAEGPRWRRIWVCR